jgi:hypothetical protein
MLFSRSFFALPLVALLAACGGRTINPVEDVPDTGVIMHSSSADDAGVDTGVTTGPTCVDVTVSAGDLACDQDSDCTEATTGTVCIDTCDCGGTAVNNGAAARIGLEVQGLETGECGCPAFGNSICVNHACTLCGFGPNTVPGCPNDCANDPFGCDAGAPDTGIFDGGVDVEAFDAPSGGCVDIDPSTYSTACGTDTDCIVIQGGEICDNDCFCGNTAVSVAGQARYDAAIMGILPGGDCPCTDLPAPRCVMGECVVCSGPNQPPACLGNP